MVLTSVMSRLYKKINLYSKHIFLSHPHGSSVFQSSSNEVFCYQTKEPMQPPMDCGVLFLEVFLGKVHSLSSGKVAVTTILKSVPSQFSPFVI